MRKVPCSDTVGREDDYSVITWSGMLPESAL